ncbi:Ankyrin-3 [Orbilia brochopaga]|nr:Ankyrin-3 [Drechslerella brochopaga]
MNKIFNRRSSQSSSKSSTDVDPKPTTEPVYVTKPPRDAGTVSKNRSGAFRATNLSSRMTKDDLEELLQDQITDEEQNNGVKIDKLDLAPDPVRPDKQIAIFQFQKGPPERFSPSRANSEGKYYLEPPPSSHSKTKIKIDTDFWGLTPLYRPEKQVAIDIVALTGLNAHAFGSWTGPLDGQERTMWLRDFLPDEEDVGPYCRVMTYGYNARTKESSVHETNDYARGLLIELNKARRADEEFLTRRLNSKQAYTLAFWEKQEFGSIFHSILGICNFGVPWKGIHLDDVDVQLQSQPDEYDHGLTLMKNISYEAKMINNNTIGFARLLSETNTRLKTFYETGKTKSLIQGANGQWSRDGQPIVVVSKNSAILGIGELEEPQDADGDHSSLVKFTGQDNRAYTTIVGFLDELIEDGEDRINKRIAAEIEQAKIRRGLTETLRSKVTRIRRRRLDPAEAQYHLGQLLRIAVDANLQNLAKVLLDGDEDTHESSRTKQKQKPLRANPDFQARTGDNSKYHKDFGWFLDSDTKDRILATRSLSQEEKNELYLGEMLGKDTTPLALAVERRNGPMAKLLLRYGANPGKPCSAFSNGSTPIHQACRLGAYDILESLLDASNGTPNVMSITCHTTPLHIAAGMSLKMCDILLNKGANVNAKLKPSGKTPLHIAAERGDHNLIVKLREYDANIEATDYQKATALHYAAKCGHLGAVKVLLNRSQDRRILDVQSQDGNTALHLAARNGYVHVVKELVDQMGAKRDIRNRLKDTALNLAEARGHDEVVQILRSPRNGEPSSPRVAESHGTASVLPSQNIDEDDEESDEDS